LTTPRPGTLWAHGAPPDIGFWGPFPRRTLHCLRMLGRATERCFLQVLSIERRCKENALSGVPCDLLERSQRVQEARQAARNTVQQACLAGQLTELNFSSFDDVFNDIERGCVDQAAAAIAVLYPPAPVAALTAADTATTRCMVEVSARGAKVLRQATRLRRRGLELIAVDPLPLLKRSEKLSLLQEAADRAGAARRRAAARIALVCPDFAAAYGRGIEEVLGVLVPVADCVLGSVYVQLTVACPVCGNSVTEYNEQCDDGNRIDTDGCTNQCTFAP